MNQTRTLGTPRLLGIVWPFIAVVLFQALLGGVSLYVLSAVRGYVAGESLWSKGQKDAVQALETYHHDCRPESYAAYREAMAIPMGGRIARLELARPDPDLAEIRRGFLQGRNRDEDIPGMVRLVRHFGDVGQLREVLVIWEQAEGLMLQIDAVAQQLHARVETAVVNNGVLRLAPEVNSIYTTRITSRPTASM